MIPEDWEVKTIKELATINDRAINKDFKFSEIEYIDIDSVDKGIINNRQYLRLNEAPSRAKRIVQKNDIIISTVRPNFKHFAFIKEAKPNTIVSTGFAVISCKKANPKFLYYYLTTDKITGYFTAIADSHTSTYPSFNPNVIENSFVPYPREKEQEMIAKILSDLDSKIELNQQMNKTLEAIGQAIFRHWFIDFEFPNEEGKPYKSSGGEMVYSEELRKEIPIDWKVGTFSDLVENTKIPLKAGEHLNNRKYVPIELLPMNQLWIEDYENYTEAKSSLISFERDDILFGAMRPYFHRVNMAPFSGITRTTVFVLRPKKKEYLCYALFYLNLDSSINYANSHSTGSTIPYAVWNNSLEIMPTIIPPQDLLVKFHNFIYPLICRVRDGLFESKNLSQIRDILLPKLMSGKIRVPVEAR